MPLTPMLVTMLKAGYLDYRAAKSARSGHVSPKMQTRINVLNSQFATRARISPALLTPTNTALASQIRDQKVAQRGDNEAMAKAALEAFLQAGNESAPAYGLKQELELLAGYLLSASPTGVKWIPGPLKKVEKAMGKTIEDYDYAWGSNKDLIRGTLACKSNNDLATVAELVKKTCIHRYGMFLLKQDNQRSIRDDGEMKSGYSGWNFVVQFKDHPAFGAEVQANTFDVLYGKHSKEEVLEYLKLSPAEYSALQTRLKFPGGIGHALYDIQDTARSKCTTEEGNWARLLALDYNDACRGNFRMANLDQVNERIKNGASMLTSDKAKELWTHAIEGSKWILPIPH